MTLSERSVYDVLAAETVAVDFETVYHRGYSVADLGYSAYVMDPRFRATLVAFASHAGAVALPPERVTEDAWRLLDGKEVVAHNAAFDMAVFARLAQLDVIPRQVWPAAWHDTAAMCRFFGLPGDLAGAAKQLLGVTLDKTVLERMADGDLFDDTRQYATADADAAYRLWASLGKHWPEEQRDLARLTAEMGFRGVGLDREAARTAMEDIEAQVQVERMQLPWKDRAADCSPKQLAALCEQNKVPVPPSTAVKDDAAQAWLALHSGTEPGRAVRAMQTIRSLVRTREVLATMVKRVRLDGRIDSHTMYFGAATGRWSGGGHGLNLQNLTNGKVGAADLRACLVPAPGKVFVVADLCQIEPRCLAWMAGDHALLEDLRRGHAIYEAHARQYMGWAGGNLKREKQEKYALAKARVLGLGYGCGAEKFVAVAKVMAGLEITPAEAKRQVDDFRAKNGAITQLWARLEEAFRECDGGTYRMPLPSGRVVRYFDVCSADMTAAVTRGGDRYTYWGGSLTENLIQAVAADVFGHGLMLVEQAGLNPVLTVHDELVCEVPEAAAERALGQVLELMAATPAWMPDLPIEAEGKVLRRYGK